MNKLSKKEKKRKNGKKILIPLPGTQRHVLGFWLIVRVEFSLSLKMKNKCADRNYESYFYSLISLIKAVEKHVSMVLAPRGQKNDIYSSYLSYLYIIVKFTCSSWPDPRVAQGVEVHEVIVGKSIFKFVLSCRFQTVLRFDF